MILEIGTIGNTPGLSGEEILLELLTCVRITHLQNCQLIVTCNHSSIRKI